MGTICGGRSNAVDDFVLRALLAGCGLALAAGPLGTVVMWRRMAYFGDSLAHSALLGVTLGLLTGWEMNLSILLVCGLFALLVAWLQARPTLPSDTALGILSHVALAAGLVAVALAGGVGVDLMGYLFGDILATRWRDVAWICSGSGLVLGLMGLLWRPLLNMSVHEGLARIDGVRVGLVRTLFMLLIALVVAMAIKIVGALLITALLIIPAAAARPWVGTPGRMALLATVVGVGSVCLGMAVSLHWDTPSGPSMVLVAGVLFAISTLRKGEG